MKVSRNINLWGEIEAPVVTIEESAHRAGVSTATVRNWIKAGYLSSPGKGKVILESLEKFQQDVAGQEKLTHRANKSLKDAHDHHAVSKDFIEKIRTADCCDSLCAEYESALSDSYRNKEGIYYTPESIVEDLFGINERNIDNCTFCDPCCGSGNFILRALDLGFQPENIYGFDVDPVAVEITKKRIYERTGFESSNIVVADFLKSFMSNSSRKYDYIFTNPPWGKKIRKKEREVIGNFLNAGKSIDTCSLFFFACLKSIKNNGILGLLLPESFFNIATYETARIHALNYKINRLVDYGKVFKGLLVKAQGLVLENKKNEDDNHVECKVLDHVFYRTSDSFKNNPKSILNFHCSDEDSEVISHIYSIPHVTLKNNAQWGLGIVTGNNKKFAKEKNEDGLMPVFKGSDIIINKGLKEPSMFIPSDLSLYQQVAPVDVFESEEKLIYKFISSKLCFFYDTEKRYVLNSVNIVIPKKDFPVSQKYLCDFFNSDIMNWIFLKIFNTHKVLRKDLESLPIHSQFMTGDVFNESDFLEKLEIFRKKDGSFRIKR